MCHLLKLSAGTESVEELARWQASARAKGADGNPRHVTRMWPKREADIVAGGSIYWVIKGLIQCRQRVLRLDEVAGGDGVRRCAIVLEPGLIRVTPAPRRPFQGWRYLMPDDAPADLPASRQDEDALPPELAGALAEIGVI
ncbi:lysophospholipase [Roseivivax isoporae LMG 25204]|uniref:Lysophospholipase n=1 Tax=Roseivivax isoporae LMG 25204 TaxID=1449351 RepID=X7F8F0_9RHOB|nr:lysophospholipase [Roseivivax isoporae LMG 25204]